MPAHFRSRRHQRLAELLLHCRQQADLKQSDVAGPLKRHQPFIANLESGQRRVDVVELLELAEIIGFDPHALIDELLATPKE